MKQLFDLHIHSVNSFDSNVSFKTIFSRAIEVGLRGVAITDHDHLTLVKSPFEEVLSIPGIEIRIEDINADIIALGLQEPVVLHRGLEETLDAIKAQDGIIIVPHPFSSVEWNPALGDEIYNVFEKVDALEVTNPKRHIDNRKARKVATTLGLAKVGGSDAHLASDIGCGVTVVRDNVDSVDDLFKLIKAKKTGGELRKMFDR